MINDNQYHQDDPDAWARWAEENPEEAEHMLGQELQLLPTEWDTKQERQEAVIRMQLLAGRK